MRVVLPLLIAGFLAGCTAQVGDPCNDNLDCINQTGAGTKLKCDPVQPDGYCTLSPCVVNGCPKEAACISFPDDSTFCMKRCEFDDDCRTGYVCVTDYGDAAFCNAAPYSSMLE